MRTYSAKSRDDVRSLAQRLSAAPASDHVFLAANIAGEGLMRPQWWVRLIVKIGTWRHRQPAKVVWASVMTRAPAIATDTLEGTVTWMLTGRDADGEGVGGFNQREMNKVARWLDDAEGGFA